MPKTIKWWILIFLSYSMDQKEHSIWPSFYTILQYPVPSHYYWYWYVDEIKTVSHKIIVWNDDTKQFSWDKKNSLLEEYKEHIITYKTLYQSLPFVQQIYLCNSITFNALQEGSDIDIVIITKHGYLRLARFFSVILFWRYGIKRSVKKGSDISKKFCLSFYIDEQRANIYHLRNNQGDIYLPYRLAHTILLYSNDELPVDFLRKQNKELLAYLPLHPLHQTIHIGITPFHSATQLKNIIEKVFENTVWRILQGIITSCWRTIVYYKKKRLPRTIQPFIIISDSMLKFYYDKRPLFQFMKKKYQEKTRLNTKW